MNYHAPNDMQRRAVLGGLAASLGGSVLLAGCGGGGSSGDAAVTNPTPPAAPAPPPASPAPPPPAPPAPPHPPPAPAPPAPPPPPAAPAPPPAPSAAYRNGQAFLFQPVPVAMASTLGGSPFSHERWGPTNRYVDFYSGWAWDNVGGDYVDANLVRQGPVAWSSVNLTAVSGSTAVFEYTGIDVTALLRHCQVQGRWAAFLLRMAPGSTQPRLIAGPLTPGGHAPPRIDVTYTDGTTQVLGCRIVARSTASSSSPMTTDQAAGGGLSLPAFMEFERPTRAVATAALRFTVVNHSSGSGPGTAEVMLLDPPVNGEPVSGLAGLASRAGRLDASIAALPGVIGAHRYVDGESLSNFVSAQNWSYNAENAYDPAIYGTGAQDLSKLPHADLGKFIRANQDVDLWSLVPSSHRGDGFEPLAPGLGALRVEMPDTGVVTGAEQANGGTTAAARKIMMPPEDYGRLDRIFVRYYVRFGGPYNPGRADRKEVRRFGNPEWTAMGGKWGITPAHATTYGGVSGSAGGGRGWTLRHKWSDCEVQLGGPNEGGITSGWHLWDFLGNNPVGHRYGGEPQAVQKESWGQLGGLGSVIYGNRWYCIEQEVRLNRVDQPSAAGDGQFWTPDGELRLWVDGRLAYERTGMVFRTLPLHSPTPNPNYLRPIRELGVKELWFNWFHGGLNNSTYRRVMFVTGLVWARERIGPMKLA